MKSRVATSPSAMRIAASSRARYSMSDRLRSAFIRSSSRLTRSRSVCRFCASRISGAAYAAWSESASVRKMNGYSSNRHEVGTTTFQPIQPITMIVCSTRNRAVPMNRAIVSANRPNASAS
jgi:hypothetical protein